MVSHHLRWAIGPREREREKHQSVKENNACQSFIKFKSTFQSLWPHDVAKGSLINTFPGTCWVFYSEWGQAMILDSQVSAQPLQIWLGVQISKNLSLVVASQARDLHCVTERKRQESKGKCSNKMLILEGSPFFLKCWRAPVGVLLGLSLSLFVGGSSLCDRHFVVGLPHTAAILCLHTPPGVRIPSGIPALGSILPLQHKWSYSERWKRLTCARCLVCLQEHLALFLPTAHQSSMLGDKQPHLGIPWRTSGEAIRKNEYHLFGSSRVFDSTLWSGDVTGIPADHSPKESM